MRPLLFILLIIFSGQAFAQVPTLIWGKKIWAKDNIQLKEDVITGISKDTTYATRRDGFIMTEKAVKDFAAKTGSSGRTGIIYNFDFTKYLITKDGVVIDSVALPFMYIDSTLEKRGDTLGVKGGLGYIPRSGTLPGKPVTGAVVLQNDADTYLSFFHEYSGLQNGYVSNGASDIVYSTGISSSSTQYRHAEIATSQNIRITAPVDSKGLCGAAYYGNNADSLTYIQKKMLNDSIAAIRALVGGGTRFGIEDSFSLVNRNIEMYQHDLNIQGVKNMILTANDANYDNYANVYALIEGARSAGINARDSSGVGIITTSPQASDVGALNFLASTGYPINANFTIDTRYDSNTVFRFNSALQGRSLQSVIYLPYKESSSPTYIPLSVNGIYANSSGNITIPSGSPSPSITGEEHTGSSAATVTLSQTPLAGTIKVYKNGIRLPASEYSLAGNVLTLTAARVATDIFIFDFNY